MAKGGQGPASPGGPSLGQEITSLKKTIDEKSKGMAELKTKLEEATAKLKEKEDALQSSVSLSKVQDRP